MSEIQFVSISGRALLRWLTLRHERAAIFRRLVCSTPRNLIVLLRPVRAVGFPGRHAYIHDADGNVIERA